MIVPSIDLMAGRAVQLRRGSEKVLESPEDPLELARRFAFHGEVAVVDLDAALGRGDNRDLVRRLCGEVPCRAGGGVREERDVVALIKAGARRVMIGTAATPEFLKRFPRDWIQVALDARDGRTVDQGWRRDTGESYLDRARRLEPFCSGFLFTQVEVEGTLEGVPLDPVRALRAATGLPLTVAGGVATLDDVRALEDLGADVQVGMALYTGRIDLDSALLARPDFGRGPLPTVVQEEDGRVLMLAWSSAASLGEALRQRRGIYWSRSRQALWRKGDTSGHVQVLTRARYDCDADALLFTVRQEGPACHSGRDACFGDAPRFDFAALRRVLGTRRGADPARSFTARLLGNRELVRAKIREEAGEV
ncbi:MAG: HisA/HisF-related TIM barrel protein, partial [Candidatus Polarisedimenticolia bacterium]